MAFPSGTLVVDEVIKTTHAVRRTRFYYHMDPSPANEKQLTVIADAIHAAWAPKLAALMPSTHQVQRSECKYYGAGNTEIEANSTVGPSAGAITYDPETSSIVPDVLPDEVSLIIRRRTGKRGRSKRGRVFITGLHEAVNNAGVVDEAYHAAAKALATQIAQHIEVEGDYDGASYSGSAQARHYDRENNVLEPVTKGYAIGTMGTRKDRRTPLRLEPL